MKWSDEDLAKLSLDELNNLLANLSAQVVKRRFTAAEAEDIGNRLRAHISSRKRRSRSTRPLTHLTLEQRVARELGQLAERLNAKYDLSEETARRLSQGSKGFKPHSLVDKQGNAKTGGSMKGGRTAIDRYISYRVRNSLASLAFLLFPDETDDAGRYVLLSTDDLLRDGETLENFVPANVEYGSSKSFRDQMRALPFADLESAAERYEAMIAELAPLRS